MHSSFSLIHLVCPWHQQGNHRHAKAGAGNDSVGAAATLHDLCVAYSCWSDSAEVAADPHCLRETMLSCARCPDYCLLTVIITTFCRRIGNLTRLSSIPSMGKKCLSFWYVSSLDIWEALLHTDGMQWQRGAAEAHRQKARTPGSNVQSLTGPGVDCSQDVQHGPFLQHALHIGGTSLAVDILEGPLHWAYSFKTV